jgi:hypothetical protein
MTNGFNYLRMVASWAGTKEQHPVPTFTYLINQSRDRFPKFGYIHVVQPRIMGSVDIDVPEHESSILPWTPGRPALHHRGELQPQNASQKGSRAL